MKPNKTIWQLMAEIEQMARDLQKEIETPVFDIPSARELNLSQALEMPVRIKHENRN